VIQRQDDFVAERRRDWDELDRLLGEGQRLDRHAPGSIARAAALYRAVCADLMRAQAAGYGPDVIGLLDGLAARGHNALYSAPPYRFGAALDLLAVEFPRTLRRHARFCALATALFLFPGLLGFFASRASRPFALQVLPESMAEQMEQSYAEGFNKGRSEGVDTGMAGFYVYNNIGIAFRTFATGLFLGVGAFVTLVANGLYIGAVMGHLVHVGSADRFFPFVVGHSALELTGIVLAGVAGGRPGLTVLAPGARTRPRALLDEGRRLVPLLWGIGCLLLLAAFVEAFWSAAAVPPELHFAVGAALWVVVLAYFALTGRRRAA